MRGNKYVYCQPLTEPQTACFFLPTDFVENEMYEKNVAVSFAIYVSLFIEQGCSWSSTHYTG